MPSTSISLTEQMLRRRPVVGAHVAPGAADHLKRSIGTFQLTMFGVGSTVGTGIFFVMSQAVPEAGPGSDRLVRHRRRRGRARGDLLRRIGFRRTGFWLVVFVCVHHARRGRRDGRGGLPAAGIRGVYRRCRGHLERVPQQAAEQSVRIPVAACLVGRAVGLATGHVNVPAIVLIVMCALLLIRGASESATVNAIMVMIKLGVLVMFVIIALTAFDTDQFKDLPRSASPASARRPAPSSFPTSASTRYRRPATR